MKRIIILMILVCICTLFISCTNRDKDLSAETKYSGCEETAVVTEETEKTFQENVSEEAAGNETLNAEIDGEENIEGFEDAAKNEPSTLPTIAVENEILKPNSEYGSPGIDD